MNLQKDCAWHSLFCVSAAYAELTKVVRISGIVTGQESGHVQQNGQEQEKNQGEQEEDTPAGGK